MYGLIASVADAVQVYSVQCTMYSVQLLDEELKA